MWSVKTFVFGRVSVAQTIELANLGIPHSSLEMDINTIAEYKDVLPHEQLLSIFDELVEMGIEIAREGDIP
jgi:hypothetical protein